MLPWVNVRDHGAKGDGVTDDTDAIHRALREAGDWGAVLFPEGTYIAEIEVLERGVTFFGASWGAVIKRKPGNNPGNRPCPIKIFADDVAVENLTIDGNRLGATWHQEADCIGAYANRLRVHNCQFVDAVSHGVIVWCRDGVRVVRTDEGSDVAPGPRVGAVIDGNLFRYTDAAWDEVVALTETTDPGLVSASAIDLADGIPASTAPACSQGIIVNNTIRQWGSHAITMHTSERSIIANNIVVKALNRGISVHTFSRDCIVANNYVENIVIPGFAGSAKYAIRVEPSSGNLVIGNIVRDTDAPSVFVGDDLRVVANSGENCGTWSVNGNRVLVSGNRINSVRAGLNLRDMTDGIVCDNDVTGTDDHALTCQTATSRSNLRIERNTLRATGSSKYALNLAEAGGGTNTNVAVIGNSMLSEHNACNFAGSNLLFERNDFTSTGNRAVTNTGTPSNVAFIRNTFTSPAGHNALHFPAINGVLVQDNEFRSVGNHAVVFFPASTATNVRIIGNRFRSVAGSAIFLGTGDISGLYLVEGNWFESVGAVFNSGSSTTGRIVHRNRGFTTHASGTATVSSGSTTAVVTHGLSLTPAAKDIALTPTNSLGNATKFWVSATSSTTFTITVDADPGETTATFAWIAQIL